MRRTALALAIGTLAAFFGTGCKVVITGNDTYETCFSTSDCGSTLDTCTSVSSATDTRSICTHSCTFDTDCEYGGVCADFAGGGTVCLQRCSSPGTSGGCELNWSCQTLATTGANACLPGGSGPACGDGTCNGSETCSSCATDCGSCALAPFDECPYGTTPNPCGSATECWGITVDSVMAGLCTRECTSDSDCPLDPRSVPGTCLQFPGAPSLCYEGCATSGDCAPGWACKTMASGLTFPSICVPM